MNRERAKKVLKLLDSINKEIELLGGAIHKMQLSPVALDRQGRSKNKFN
ncbi:MAG: hypothetical protein HC819_19965 [Cyclobacteriaceae bacterium]|nr:hypothetical protein [Cyclobacteriaceae bacterium]